MTVEVLSLGCRLNGVEAEAMRVGAERAGLSDLLLVNTCAVTAEAARQSGQAIRSAARARPGRPIAVTGCAAEIDPARFAAIPGVTALIANREKLVDATWRRRLAEGGAVEAGQPRANPLPTGERSSRRSRPGEGDTPSPDPSYPPHPALSPSGRGFPAPSRSRISYGPSPESEAAALPAVSDASAGRVRSFVQVQTGCDHRCTFCIIPFGRGASRSALPGDVVASVRGAVELGAREVVLTGVDLTAYGADLPGGPALGGLVREILRQVPDLPRLRLSSVDSVEADRDLVAALAEEPRLMPHLHLSLQAGDDLVLKRMKRRHGRGDAISLCRDLRRLRPDIVFGADLIAGFPTETEAMFGRSLDLVEECGLTYLHVFPYSPRPGTPAARMPPVPTGVVRERAARLRAAGEAALAGHLAGLVGRSPEVLVENSGMGRTETFAPVRFATPAPRGEIVRVPIAGHDGRALLVA